jgi:signal transduction histidine kinase
MNKTWDDDLSSLVAKSGETFSIHGEAMDKFPVSALGKSALVAPVKANRQTVAILAVMRKKDEEFSTSDHTMLDAVCDYASISLVNVRLFQALDARAANLQIAVENAKENERAKHDIIRYLGQEFRGPLSSAKENIVDYLIGEEGKLTKKQLDLLQDTQEKIERAGEVVEAMAMLETHAAPTKLAKVNLCILVNNLVEQSRESAMENAVTLRIKLPSQPQYAHADASQIEMVLAALLSNAIKFSHPNGDVLVEVFSSNGQLQVSVQDHGVGISKRHADRIFERFFQLKESDPGMGIGLTIAQEIVTAHGGKIWMESNPDAGATFHFTLNPSE